MSPTLAQITLDLLAIGEASELTQRMLSDTLIMTWCGLLGGEMLSCTRDVPRALMDAARDRDEFLAHEAYQLWQTVRDSLQFKAAQPSVVREG